MADCWAKLKKYEINVTALRTKQGNILFRM